MQDEIRIGDHAFTTDGKEEFGAIRGISSDGKRLTVYVENAGDFDVSADAVVQAGYQKVTFDCRKLDETLRSAIGHAHDAELPNDAAIEDYSRDIGQEDEDIPDEERLEIARDLASLDQETTGSR
ncbi:MAG TPA: hypothetical protein VEL28_05640 [Candidatus Binatia bacterium]|nr:hypothetical protein [Candidatus Binatia bacterium]